jgi:RHS repeat-associated protein
VDLEAQFDADNFTQSVNRSLDVEGSSNRLLGFTQTTTTVGGTSSSTVSGQVSYTVDANGAMTSDGLRTFAYDASNRLAKAEAVHQGDTVAISYWHNALGQRVFKSEPQVAELAPDEKSLSQSFTQWLQSLFGWVMPKGNAKATLGTAFVYDEQWNLVGEYDNGGSQGKPNTEHIWLPIEGGQAIPVGMLRNGALFAVHADHLGTPRLITDAGNNPVWQWPYSAFGSNKPTGILSAVTLASGKMRLKGTSSGTEMNVGMPGQYRDLESNLFYNGFRTYDPRVRAGYTQPDHIGLAGGLNRFTYVEGNPLLATDRRGEAGALAIAGGAAVAGYSMYKMLTTQNACEKMCEATQGDAVQACGDPDRRDIVDAQKNQRILACKASCAMGSVMSRLLPGKLK